MLGNRERWNGILLMRTTWENLGLKMPYTSVAEIEIPVAELAED